MTGQQVAEQSAKQKRFVQPFEIEFGYGDHWVTTFRERYRGRWSRFHLNGMEGHMGQQIARMPDIPGLHMRITPGKGEVVVFDPLESDADLLKTISAIWKQASPGFNSEFKAVKPTRKTLDVDMMKTLLLELRRSWDLNEEENRTFRIVSGELPSMDDIKSMPGDELDSPMSPYRRCKYVKDRDKTGKILEALREANIGTI